MSKNIEENKGCAIIIVIIIFILCMFGLAFIHEKVVELIFIK